MDNNHYLLAQDGSTEWVQIYTRTEMDELFGTVLTRRLNEGDTVVLRHRGTNILYTDMKVATRYIAELNTAKAS